MATRLLTRICVLAILLGAVSSTPSFAQTQKDYPWQKKGQPPLDEEDQEGPPNGGYQTPPPTGALEGATREFGVSGGEIELPALRLRFPRVRLPSLSMFLTPPRMHTDAGIAPMVQQIQNQVSVPTGAPAPEANQEGNGNGKKGVFQKGSYQQSGMMQENSIGAAEYASMRGEMEEFENRLDSKLAVLADAIEQLAQARVRETEPQRPNSFTPTPTPLPFVDDDAEQSPVRHSSYVTARRITPTPAVRPTLRRLPATTQPAAAPSVFTACTPLMLRVPAPGTSSPLYR